MKYILVCGGAGYIGSHCVEELLKKDYNVVVFDNLIYGHREFVEDVNFFEGDLSDINSIKECFKKYDIESVMHFSAYAYVGESVIDPEKYYYNNVVNTLNLLKVMKEYNVREFIFSSTCATYGNPEYMPLNEKHGQNPVNPYGNTKYFVEKILKDYERSYGIKHIIFRYFNAAGASLTKNIGEWHNPETHLIPLVLDAASGKRKNITVFGDDYNTSDGTCIRDYIHVTDIAHAHILGLEYLRNSQQSDFFNIGSEKGFSVYEIISKCEEITGKTIERVLGQRREGDPDILIADSTKIKKILNWKPRFSDIHTIIESAWKWHRNCEK